MPSQPSTSLRRAAIYRRVSGPDDPRQVSLDEQLRSSLETAKRLGYVVDQDDIYTDHYTSAEFYDRPAYSVLRRAIKARKYKAVVTWCLDRLSRKQAHQAHMLGEIEEHGAVYVSATEDLDGTPEGVLLRSIRGYVAEVERVKIIDRTQGAKRRIRESGQIVCGGMARFGYAYDAKSKTRVIVEAEAEVVRRIFAMAVEGHSATAIATTFNREGVPTPGQFKGKDFKGRRPTWRCDTVLEILHDASYTGAPMVQGRFKLVGKVRPSSGRKRLVDALPSEWVETLSPTPAIIEPALFKKANDTMARGKGGQKTRNRSHPRLLRGIAVCSVCGRNMTSSYGTYRDSPSGKDKIYYACSSKYKEFRRPEEIRPCGNRLTPVEWADEHAWAMVKDFAASDTVRAWVIERQRALYEEKDWEADREFHLEAVRKGEGAVDILVGEFGTDTDPAIMKALRQRLEVLRTELNGHREAVADLEERLRGRQSWAELMKDFEATWAQFGDLTGHELSFDEKRKVLEWANIRFKMEGKKLWLMMGVRPLGASSCTLRTDTPSDLVWRPQGFLA